MKRRNPWKKPKTITSSPRRNLSPRVISSLPSVPKMSLIDKQYITLPPTPPSSQQMIIPDVIAREIVVGSSYKNLKEIY
jgi:hypothetical protein